MCCGFLAGSVNGPGELCIVGVGLVLRGAPNVGGGNVSSHTPLSLGSHLV